MDRGYVRLEQTAITAAVVSLVVVPIAVHGWPATLAGNAFTATLVAAGLTVLWWRSQPRLVAVLGGALWLVPALLSDDGWFPLTALAVMLMLAAAAAVGWTGRAAWVTALCVGIYVLALWRIVEGTSLIALAVVTVPGFAAGTVFRLYQETADALARRGRELEDERQLFAELAVSHERARIAAELHDIVGHAISVMVIQAAAGQRLVDRDPVRAGRTFENIAESARQGEEDLQRLIALLGGAAVAGPDLSLINEVVTRAERSGLDVSCLFEGDHDHVVAATAHVAFRVVQESLTNALRHAPGATVRVLVDCSGRGLTVSVENGPPVGIRSTLPGTGRGLAGLDERVRDLGGHLDAGATIRGGWLVEATLPDS